MSDAYSRDEVSSSMNRAADEILEAVSAGDTGLRDALNLLVNASLSYLTGEASDLDGVAAVNYSEDSIDEILGWIGHG